MKLWEYKVKYLDERHDTEEELNQLGAMGWELVGFEPDGSWSKASLKYIFKRLIEE